MLALALVLSLAVPDFGPTDVLRPHQLAMGDAEWRANKGDWDGAKAVLTFELNKAEPEARGLLILHIRMLDRLATLDGSLPKTARGFVPYVFQPPMEKFPSAMEDLKALATLDDDVQNLLTSPIMTTVVNKSEAVALSIRGSLIDTANRQGLPLRAATGALRLRIIIEQEEVTSRSLFDGTGMHAYTTHIVTELTVPGREPVTNGVVQQVLGINEATSLTNHNGRTMDRILTAVVVEIIRRSLLGELGT